MDDRHRLRLVKSLIDRDDSWLLPFCERLVIENNQWRRAMADKVGCAREGGDSTVGDAVVERVLAVTGPNLWLGGNQRNVLTDLINEECSNIVSELAALRLRNDLLEKQSKLLRENLDGEVARLKRLVATLTEIV